jgi:hypothetical protein
MSKLIPTLAATGLAVLASCTPPPPAPPPRFRPTPPYPPEQVHPYGTPPGDLSSPQPPTDPYSLTPPASPRPSTPAVGGYPTAERTANPNQVISPYEPYNVIDVEGFKSGQLARDPSNQKIFRVP